MKHPGKTHAERTSTFRQSVFVKVIKICLCWGKNTLMEIQIPSLKSREHFWLLMGMATRRRFVRHAFTHRLPYHLLFQV